MDINTLVETKISVLIDAREANKTFWDAITQYLLKTKTDTEIICLVKQLYTDKIVQDWTQKNKIQQHVFDSGLSMAKNFASLADKASGSNCILLFNVLIPVGNLVQVLQTNKKLIVSDTLVIGNQNNKPKGSKVKIPFGVKAFNSLTRLFTPINLRDANSGVVFAKTQTALNLLNDTLSGAHNFTQVLYLSEAYKIPVLELPISAEKRVPVNLGKAFSQIFSLRFNYFVKDALWQIKQGKTSLSDGNNPIYRMAYFVCFLLAIFFMPVISQDYGSTWDEKAHNEYAQLSYNYLTSFGSDTAALAESTSGSDYVRQAYRFYGEQLNTIAAFVYNWAGTGVYETRHFINSIYGLIGLIFASLIAFELAGWRAATLAILFMFFNPGWLGHSMNNPTDIPFATGFAFAGYFMIKVMKTLPKPKFSHVLWMAVGLGIGIASRVGAFLIVAYFGLFLGVNWLAKFKDKQKNLGKLIMPYAKLLLIVTVIGFILGILLWPYALNSPIKHTIDSFSKASSNAFYTNNVELFEGKRMYMLTDAPWYYVFKFLGIGNPIYVLLGVLLSLLLIKPLSKKVGLGNLCMLLFMVFFPILYAEYSNLNYYNGWRHYLFILPFAIPLGAISYDYLLSQKKFIAIGSACILLVLFAKPTYWLIKNHPNEYVYFNEFTGGLAGAYGNYETDYYSNSCREAAEWIANKHPNDSLVIGINNEVTTAAYWAHQINPRLNFVWTRESEEQKLGWDYLILTSRTFSKNELVNGSFPPKGTVYTVEADGIPLAAVVKREDWNMPRGYNALDRQNFDSAIVYFENATRYAPKDEETWRMLGFTLINRGRLDSAEKMLKKSIEIYPENFSAYSNLGLVYFNNKEFKKATEAFAHSTTYKENMTESWYYSALAYLNLGDYPNAIKQLEMAVKHNASIPEVYYYLGKAYDAVNNPQKAVDNYQIAVSINPNMVQAWGDMAATFNKLGKKEEANFCMGKYTALGGK
ncbi:MAG: tetratricopeptide repeat protein [Bacteroidota bacterium]|nr:tetratricopeptide repeat protein [Bacteroidota bacterium]